MSPYKNFLPSSVFFIFLKMINTLFLCVFFLESKILNVLNTNLFSPCSQFYKSLTIFRPIKDSINFLSLETYFPEPTGLHQFIQVILLAYSLFPLSWYVCLPGLWFLLFETLCVCLVTEIDCLHLRIEHQEVN